jgi:hypothetical protein
MDRFRSSAVCQIAIAIAGTWVAITLTSLAMRAAIVAVTG